MFITCGYDFCSDVNALNPAPTSVNGINTTKLENGIFQHWNVTADVTSPYSPAFPTTWDFLTIMDCNFNGNINAGNVDFALSTLDGFKIKRRKITDFNWVTLKFIPITDVSEFSFVFNDNLAQSLQEYEYAFVPVISGVEGNYITNTINSQFDGVFICDLDTIYKFYAGVQYGASEQVQKIGVFEPYGRQYPVVVSNGLINYSRGSFNGTVLPTGFLEDGNLDRLAMVKKQKILLDFLTNKKVKILKDWNGRSILMIIVDNPSATYLEGSGMGIANIGARYVEMGDSNSQKDLYNTGMISEAE